MKDDLIRLDELLFESLKKEYTYLGKQFSPLKPNHSIELYNCKECDSTISKSDIVSHYVNNHYELGLNKLRKRDQSELSEL